MEEETKAEQVEETPAAETPENTEATPAEAGQGGEVPATEGE